MAAIDRARIWRFAIVAPFATSAILVSNVAGTSLVSWDLSDLAPQYLVDWRVGVFSLVLAGLAAIALAGGWVAGRSAIRRVFGRRRAAPAALQNEVVSLSRRIGYRVPRLTVSDRSTVPAAVGFREICVPAAIQDSQPADERRALLAHEIGHLIRRDPLWLAVAGCLSRLAVFQPLNRFALARLRQASEEAADDFAVQATGNPEALARALACLVSVLLLRSAGVAATGSPVVDRVSRLLDEPSRTPRPWRRPARLAAGGVALALLLSLAPGITVSVDALADRLPWLTPSRDEPNARMLEVRYITREWRESFRRGLR